MSRWRSGSGSGSGSDEDSPHFVYPSSRTAYPAGRRVGNQVGLAIVALLNRDLVGVPISTGSTSTCKAG